MSNRTDKNKLQPLWGFSVQSTSQSAKLPAIPHVDPETILREARKKARAEARGLSGDTLTPDAELLATLNKYNFSAIDKTIAKQSPSATKEVDPSTRIHVPILDPTYPTVTKDPTTLPHSQTSLPTPSIPTDTTVETIKRIPPPFLRATDEVLPADPPRLQASTVSDAFPSMNSGNAGSVTGDRELAGNPSGIDRLSRLEAMMESIATTLAQSQVTPAPPPPPTNNFSRLDQLEGLLASMASIQ